MADQWSNAQVQAVAVVRLFAFGREEDEGNGHGLLVGPQGFDDAVAVQFRHHHVAQDQVGGLRQRGLDAQAAIGGGSHRETFHLQRGR